MSAPVDFATVLVLDVCTGLVCLSAAAAWRALRGSTALPRSETPAPASATAPEPTMLDRAIAEAQAAMDNLAVVEHVLRVAAAEARPLTRTERGARAFATWSLARSAEALHRAYNDATERGPTP